MGVINAPAVPDPSVVLAASLAKLPPFRPAAMKLLQVSWSADSAAASCEAIFESDPALTAELLALSNSAFYGRRMQILTIRKSMRMLGLERVRCLAITIALRSQMGHGARHPYLATVWAHSIAAAVAAEAVGEVFGSPGMYTFGLTHDLGRLGLFLTQGLDYARELSVEFSSVQQANTLEKRIYGMTHCEAGALVARAWGFPEPLATCMGNHHEPFADGCLDPKAVVSLACQMADSLGFLEVPQADAPPWPELPPVCWDRPELEPETLWDEINRRIAGLSK